MTLEERQEYYDLIEEEISFQPGKGQKWVLTFEERHTFQHDIRFHVYTESGDTFMLVYEIVDVMELDVKQRLHKLSDTLSGNLRILMSTLKYELPGELEQEAFARDGSQFKLTFALRKDIQSYQWEYPKSNFKRIRPVLKLIWAIDKWWHGSKAMGWSDRAVKEGVDKLSEEAGASTSKETKLASQAKARPTSDQKKGRLDPFGNIWTPME